MVPPVFLNAVELAQIDRYYNALRAPVLTPGVSGQLQPPAGGGSGLGSGQGASPGQGSGPVAPGHGAGPTGRSLGDLLCCRGQDRVLDEETENLISELLSKDLPILELEGVDEGAQDADATMKDELMLLARGSEIWARELVKYLQVERKERDEMQEEQVVRMENWLRDVVATP